MDKIIGTYCEGTHCSKRDMCAKHVKANIPNAVYEYLDWSTYGSGTYYNDENGNTICEITHSCGDDSENYPHLEVCSL